MSHRNRYSRLVAVVLLLASTGCVRDWGVPEPTVDGGGDTEAPSFTGWVVDPSVAGEGVTVSLRFDASESLPLTARGDSPNPEVVFAGLRMACTNITGATWQCLSQTDATLMTEGEQGFTVTGADAAGNETTVTAPDTVTLDFTAPTPTLTVVTDPVLIGLPITFTVTADETVGSPVIKSTDLLADVSCTPATEGTSFTCAGTVNPASVAGTATFTTEVTDPAGNVGQTSATATLVPPDLTLTDLTVSPNPAKAGDTVTFSFAGNLTFTACSALVEPALVRRSASCTPVGTDCTCTVTLDNTFTEGRIDVDYTGEALGKTKTLTSDALIFDNTVPTIDATGFALVRTPLGQNDAVTGDVGTLADDAGVLYPERAIAEVRVWDAASAGNLLVTLTPAIDGSTSGELPSTTGTTGDYAPQAIWVSSVDLAGNESPRGAVTTGVDNDDPTADGLKANLEILPVGTDELLSSEVGFASDATSALAVVEAFADATTTTVLHSRPLATDGSFATGPVGDVGGGRLYLEAVDKVGRRSPRVSVRKVTQTMDFSGMAPFSPDATSEGFHAARYPAELPDNIAPGAAEAYGDEPVQADLDAISAVDGTTVRTDAPGRPLATGPTLEPTRPTLDAHVVYAGWDETRREMLVITDFGNQAWTRKISLGGVPASALGPWQRREDPANNVTHNSFIEWRASRNELWVFSRTGTSSNIFRWNGTSWTTLNPASSPPTNSNYGLVVRPDPYASGKDYFLAFGGSSDPDMSFAVHDTLDWQSANALTPARRGGRAAWFDATTNDELVIFGGDTWNGTTWDSYSNTTTTSSAAWTQFEHTNGGPPGRYNHAMARDPKSKKPIMFGGRRSNGNLLADTWEWGGSAWTQRTPTTSPPARENHSMMASSYLGGILLYGGEDASGNVLTDTWLWNGTNWLELTEPPTPKVRSNAAVAYDPVRGIAWMFGGSGAANWGWAWENGTWRTHTKSPRPQATSRPVMAYDPSRDEIVFFDGESGRRTTWTFDPVTEDWTQQSPTNAPPAGVPHDLVWDATRRKMVASIGGEWWTWDGTDWAPLTEAAGLTTQELGLTAWDGSTGQIHVVGSNSKGTDNHEALEGSTWTTINGSILPSTRGSAIFNPQVESLLYLDDPIWYWNPTAGWNSISSTFAHVGGTGDRAFYRRDTGTVYIYDDATTSFSELTWHTGNKSLAIHQFSVRVPKDAVIESLTVSWTGTGEGAANADLIPDLGAELHLWDAGRASWIRLGMHMKGTLTEIADTYDAATAGTTLNAGGQVWLMATSRFASRPGTGSVISVVETDAISATMTYVLP